MSDFTRQTIRFGMKNTYVDVPMILSVSKIKSYAPRIAKKIIQDDYKITSSKYVKGEILNRILD